MYQLDSPSYFYLFIVIPLFIIIHIFLIRWKIKTQKKIYLTKQSNGLVYVIERMLGQPLFACVSLHKSERSTLSDIAADLL